nr:unnamed protein product [Digitaria exilis]
MQTRPTPSFHVHGADIESATSPCELKRDRDDLLVSIVGQFSMIVLGILLPIYFFVYDMPPEFSVHLPAIKGLDTLAPSSSSSGAPISPVFDVTLHASNRRGTGRCYHNGEALVSYAGFTIATGRVPGFCLRGKGVGEIGLQLASADGGVRLPMHLLNRMARERRVGAVQLDVEVKLFRRDDGSDRPMWIWCELRMDEAQPPSSCTVLGLQNWFSMNYDA